MNPPTQSPRLLVIGLALAIVLDTAGQVLWKICVAGLPATGDVSSIVAAALHQPLFLVLAAVFLLQLFNWLRVLERAELSYAQPITSLSYVTVCVLSVAVLGEEISPTKALGVLCVLGGVGLVSQSGPLERAEPEAKS